ncbi:MAG: glycosyltransferase family 4 protein, partial [Patescibacteria group bacterium]
RVFPSKGRAWSFLGRLVTHRFDAVFVHMSPIWVVLGGWWWRLTGQRTVLWYTHGTASRDLRIALTFANEILTATPEAFPIRSAKVRAIGHGISPRFFEVARYEGNDARKGNGLVVVSVGRISPRKRVRETIELFAAISRRCPDARFTWVGEALTDADKEYEKMVRDDVERLGLSDRVRFVGAMPFTVLPSVYASADLLLHLSATGSLDKVVLEALAAGCAVFSTNPATCEAVPSAYWGGPLDATAVEESIIRANRGVQTAMRQDVMQRFFLKNLISRIIETCFPLSK